MSTLPRKSFFFPQNSKNNNYKCQPMSLFIVCAVCDCNCCQTDLNFQNSVSSVRGRENVIWRKKLPDQHCLCLAGDESQWQGVTLEQKYSFLKCSSSSILAFSSIFNPACYKLQKSTSFIKHSAADFHNIHFCIAASGKLWTVLCKNLQFFAMFSTLKTCFALLGALHMLCHPNSSFFSSIWRTPSPIK